MAVINKELTLDQKIFILANVGYYDLDSRNSKINEIMNTENLSDFLQDFGIQFYKNDYRNTDFILKTTSEEAIYRPFNILYTLMGNHSFDSRKYFNTPDTSYAMNFDSGIGSGEGVYNDEEDKYYLKLTTFKKFINPYVVKDYRSKMAELQILFKKWELPFKIKWYKNAVNIIEI